MTVSQCQPGHMAFDLCSCFRETESADGSYSGVPEYHRAYRILR